MGQGTSSRSVADIPFNRNMKRRSFLERKGSILRRPKRELSATFNMYKEDFHVELLDINTATEEELMTLVGINRTIAHNIVDYRQAIGQFKKVEDLALVSGVGANKLALIRTEICVNQSRRRRNSRSSSSGGTHSEDSIAGTSDYQDVKSNNNPVNGSVVNGYASNDKLYSYKLLDINGANIFQLMTVRGINQKMAANIVCYRERKGPFKSMDDLSKVKGIGHKKINELKSYLYVNNISNEAVNGCHKYTTNGNSRENFRRSSSEPVTTTDTFNGARLGVNDSEASTDELSCAEEFSDEKSIYEMLAMRCPRPILNELFHFKRNGQPALRLGSWNLEQFTLAKVGNLGVIEVVCRTILENGVSLVAFQDVKDPLAVERLCDELNSPYLDKVKSWVGSTGVWKCHVSESVSVDGQEAEYLAFLYDTCRGITVVKSETLHFTPSNNNGPTFPGAFYATFKVENIEFSVLTVRLPEEVLSNNENTSIAIILGTWLEKVKETSLLIVLGDFNSDMLAKDFGMLSERFDKLIPIGDSDDLDVGDSEGLQHQNVWLSLSVQKFYTGVSGVVRKGLCHLTIPKGWSLGGSVSSQSPVWVEFYVPSLLSLSVLSNEADLRNEEGS
ncbi:Endonuclease/exonuclease/phosphatase domain-containing protein 1 [Chamberlinius hualienensis]